MGLSLHPLETVLGGDALQNAEIIKRIFHGERSAYRDVVLLNAGACIYLSGLAETIAEGVTMAANAVDSGKAAMKLEQLIHTTEAYSHVS
ncbi:anthranilate phosphoribosyltransferase [compost metagenome]